MSRIVQARRPELILADSSSCHTHCSAMKRGDCGTKNENEDHHYFDQVYFL